MPLKRFLFIFFVLILGFAAKVSAQIYGNEWISYSQSYYKVYVSTDGMCRLNYSTLASAGIPLNSIDPRSIQVFNKGIEQYIYVKGENDGVFNTNDYIEFYGEHNDGSLDTPLYKGGIGQPNKNYSLFSDSAVYFVTWNSSVSNRRISLEADNNFSTYTPTPYVFKTSRQDYTTQYFAGETFTSGITDPDYTWCEGWFDYVLNLGQSKTKSLPTKNKYPSGPAAEAEIVEVGASNFAALSGDHHLRITFAGNTIDTVFEGYKVLKFNRSIPISLLGSSASDFTFASVDDIGSGSDRTAIAYIQIKYPHSMNLEGTSAFWLQAQDALQAKSFFNFTNINIAAGDTAQLYDITNHRLIKMYFDGTTHKCLLPNSGSEKNCMVFTQASVKNITHLYPVNGNASFMNYKSIADNNLSDYFIITHNSLLSSVQDYNTYRNNSGYHSQIIDVDHLYDEFAYGILKSPMGLRNFIRYAYNKFVTKPKYVFIIGKGLRAGADGAFPAYRNNLQNYNLTLVPSIGNPPSDVLFSQGILDTLFQPAVPIGRLAAQSTADVDLYLEKVQQYELQQANPQEWMKTVLHFGGGTSAGEQAGFANYLNHYKQSIQGSLFGADVKTFLKTSTAPIQINQSDSLKTLINNGVSMMTFFGHAAGIGFDQSIDNPSEYNNDGKYPFLLANSCYAGDIFQTGGSSSEEFVLIPHKGMIGYLASISVGLPDKLNTFSDELYKNISYKKYGSSIGDIIKNTISTIQIPDIALKETCLTMTLHGDPAIRINSASKPDYTVDATDVYFSPANVTSDLDTFNIAIIPTNIAKAVEDSFMVQVIRTFPDGSTTQTYLKLIKAPFYKDTIALRIPVDVAKGLGLNRFKITLDFYNEIDEISDMNNSVEVPLFIKSSEIIPVLPVKYAIIPSLPVTLQASTGFSFIGSETYEFQLDTTDKFSSPIRQTGHVTHIGGVVSWTPTFPILIDSIVYYWRVSIDSGGGHQYNWRESSFQYINGKRGWGQAHFYQFKNDNYQYVRYNRPMHRFDFVNNVKSLTCQTGFYPHIAWNDEWYKINDVEMAIWSSLANNGNGVLVAVFDSVSSDPWTNPIYTEPVYRFDISTQDSAGRASLQNLLSSIPANNHVLVYSHRNHYAQSFSNALYSQFESIGSGQIRTLPNNIPYIIFGKKGSSIGSAHEVEGSSITSVVNLADTLVTKWNSGYILSETVGPASKWISLHWHQRALTNNATDYVRLNVIGIKTNGAIDTLIRNLPPDSADIYNLNTRINAVVYPNIKLLVRMSDDSLHTPAQMKRWQVFYDGVPETALDPALHFVFHGDTVQEGDKVILSTATRNISMYDMDSLLIKYWMVDKNHTIHPLGQFRHRKHPANDVLFDTISAPTSGMDGLNSLWMEVNPNSDQPEQTHFNNIGVVNFFVSRDKTNPLLDVTFDGVHILDGDIVSARPEIQISLKDENKFMALNDTGSFRVYLFKPGSTNSVRVYFGSSQQYMQFVPASLPNNSCKVIYKADLPEDGTYKLMVEAQDKSHNESGANDYTIDFEVINKPSITHVMNWPNPFNNATHFVFTLTGSEIPTYFKIQIITITGKVVREIDLSELGHIHIGRNITDYAWNGTDMFGDRLANGVYLYRVLTRINETSIELNKSGADPYFKKEFGKMYLLGN